MIQSKSALHTFELLGNGTLAQLTHSGGLKARMKSLCGTAGLIKNRERFFTSLGYRGLCFFRFLVFGIVQEFVLVRLVAVTVEFDFAQERSNLRGRMYRTGSCRLPAKRRT